MKWAMYFDEWDLNWKDIFSSPFLSCMSTKLRYFQFKILHRYLAVNKLLAQIGIVDSDLCSFCKREKEDIQHFFWDCTELVSFWQNIQTHMLKNSVHLDMRNVVLGLFDIENSKFNFVILHAKYYIYKCKWDESKPNYNVFIKILKTCKDTEKMIALKNNRVDKWNSKWNKIYL